MKIDVGIVGGGVAGSALALVLARAGVSVAIVERELVFRDRIRGEAIHPWGTREIDRLGLRSLIVDHAGGLELPVWQTYRNRQKQDPFAWTDLHASIPPVLSVRHPDIQNALIAAAADAGAHIFRPATVTLGRTDAGPRMEIHQGDKLTTLAPRLVVGADGSRSATRSWIGGEATRDPIHHYLAGTLIDGIDLPVNAAHHASGFGGFSMVFPQTRDQYRLYFVCLPDERASFQGAGQAEAVVGAASRFFPEGSLDNWTAHGPTGFFPNADIVSSVISGRDCVLIGDAAGANDPSLGHGMALTFKDVRELSGLLLSQSDWDDGLEEFATRRAAYFDVLRQHAIWISRITTETGAEADAARARVARARQLDPAAGGFTALFAMGPDGLVADEAARQHFLGLDLAS